MFDLRKPALAVGLLAALGACQSSKNLATTTVNTPVAAAKAVPTLVRADGDMDAVLIALGSMGGKPIETLSATEARQQPSPADAVKKLLQERGMSTAPTPKMAHIRNITIPGPDGALPARAYIPAGKGPLPVVVYYHGGGWVIATNDTYDASARAIAAGAKAIVVAVEYRKAPEHKFPAAHSDAFAAYDWVLKNAKSLGGDPERVAVAGESAGGSLAIGVSRLAKEHKIKPPVHEVLIYPVAGIDTDTESYQQNASAKPLNKPMMPWFFDKYASRPEDLKDPLIDVVDAPDLAGLPPTTIVSAEIDPLRSEAGTLAVKLQQAGVPVERRVYEGVTHEFFGMGAVVADAKAAEDFVGERLRAAFAKGR